VLPFIRAQFGLSEASQKMVLKIFGSRKSGTGNFACPFLVFGLIFSLGIDAVGCVCLK